MNSLQAQKDQFTGDADLAFRIAEPADVDAIVALVNSAYRGDSSRAGWTTEADILGGQRTDASEIAKLIGEQNSVFLLCLRGGKMIGSAHVQRIDAVTAYVGMLVIKPGLQGQGLGRRFINQAERFAQTEWSIRKMQMQVITLRHELIRYYERCGYLRTGELRPFPATDPRFGLPKVDGLVFEVLEKTLA